jgi:MFS transporter, putative metabolite:H+ symporter
MMTGAGGHRTKFEHPIAFWAGIAITTAGIVVQLPMFFQARMNHYRLAGMPISPLMLAGMAAIMVGMVVSTYGVYPARPPDRIQKQYTNLRVRALDTAPIKASHAIFLCVLTIAIVIDTMKPTTLAFVSPGAELEYGLRGPLLPRAHALPIGLYALSGITGTVIGSVLWGHLSDKIGRRASLLLANIIFIASSTCGAMPRFWLNLVCCLLMGIGAGGMLPIAVTLMSETIPARHRGWLMVLVGGGGAGLAYVATSWLSATIGAPDHFGWRIMWLVGLPTGLLLLMFNRWIPESPRFLLLHGRDEEARDVMQRYGAVLVDGDADAHEQPQIKDRFGQLFNSQFFLLSSCIVLLGISIGLLQYGFQQWMPSNLQKLGYTSVSASTVLRNSSLYGLPLCIPIAYLYGFWSSRKTIIVLMLFNLLDMAIFAAGSASVVQHRLLMEALLIIPTWSVGLLAAVLAIYAVEVYPTIVRSRGCGLAAGATKAGGVLILALAATEFTSPSIRYTALIAMIPMVLALPVLIRYGPETNLRSLEHINVGSALSAGGRRNGAFTARRRPDQDVADPAGAVTSGRPPAA